VKKAQTSHETPKTFPVRLLRFGARTPCGDVIIVTAPTQHEANRRLREMLNEYKN